MNALEILTEDPRFSIFLEVLQDVGTDNGAVPVLGIKSRSKLSDYKVPMKPDAWLDWQLIVAAPKYHYWKLKYAKKNGTPIRPLPRTCAVIDFDESKRSDPRSLEELLELLPVPWLCAVPTRTVGNWQVYLGFNEPAWADQVEAFLALHFTQLGGDPAYNVGTLSWNPIYRTFNEQEGSGYTTVWNPALLDGEIPTFDINEYVSPTSAIEQYDVIGGNKVRDNDNDLSRERLTFDELVAAMERVVVGAGQRHTYLFRYMFARVCQEQKVQGRLLTAEEIHTIGHETDIIFPEPVSADDIEGEVAWFMKVDGDGRQRDILGKQRFLGKRSGYRRAQKARRQFFKYMDTLVELQAHYGKAIEPEFEQAYWDYHNADPEHGLVINSYLGELENLPEVTCRRATWAHVAALYGVETTHVQNAIKKGKRAGYLIKDEASLNNN